MQSELRRLARAYSALSVCHSQIVRAASELEMLASVCRTLVDAGGYRMAWAGYAEADEAQSVRPVAVAGQDAGYLDSIRISWADDELGKGPTGTAIRTGRPSINRNTSTNPDYGPWREGALRHGFQSSIALPLVSGAERLGALAVYAAEPDAFDTDECSFLVRFAEDLAFGMASLRTRGALQESEERFRQLAESIHEVFWLTELQTQRIIYVSPAYEEVWGRSRQSLHDAPEAWLEAIHPEDRERVQEAIARWAPGATYDQSYRVVRPDGTVRWVRSRRYPVVDESGRVFRVAGVAQDITQQRRLEEQFLHAQKMEAVGRLAGGVAHDFNNLLSVILSYASIVAQKLPPGDPSRDDVGQIEAAGLRAAELTTQLLAFSRQQVLRPKVIDLNVSLERTDKLLRRVLGEDIELRTVAGASLWPVRADPGQVEQILMNLAVNARDAMPHGGTLVIETSNGELDEAYAREHPGTRPGPHVMLAVSDTGVGMDRATLERIFEPFYTTKDTGKGTGLGLSTVFGIVQQSGGSIWVYSEAGKGTTFKVWLPRAEQAAQAAAPAPRPSPPLGGTETLLVAEDDAQVRQLVQDILEAGGYTVLAAASAEEALRLAAQHQGTIHALITDVVMPGVDGRELGRRLSARFPHLRRVYMSGYTDNVVVHRALLDPGVKFLQKPITPTKLSRIVREALDAPR